MCDCDEIVQFHIEFVNSNGEDLIYSTRKGPIVSNTFCGGLALDKFNNLFYVDTMFLLGSD